MSYLTIETFGYYVLLAPLLLFCLLGLTSLVDRRLNERLITHSVQFFTITGLLAAIIVLAWMLIHDNRHLLLEIGTWIHIPHYNFHVKFVFDRLSVPFVILTYLLCGTIGAFAGRYMHREPGYNRFFTLYALFMLGMVMASMSGTIEMLFAGWEMVGLSSALLVAFFHDRVGPVRNGLRVWSVYRLADAALLIAAVVMHHLRGEGDFDQLLGLGPWPLGEAMVTPHQALVVGLLLLFAAAGKSALVPFSGWLPRAMEGPTPSSAIFYGALSVHLGAFLLLRMGPLLNASPLLSEIVIVVGLLTAFSATVAGRVQTDIKSALTLASLAQVGIIVAEIGFHLPYVALVHILGHGCMRTLQFVRAPSLLTDYRNLENALGSRLPNRKSPLEWIVPPMLQAQFYRPAIERGYWDALLNDYAVAPVVGFFRACDRLERRWTRWLAGRPEENSESGTTNVGAFDDVT